MFDELMGYEKAREADPFGQVTQRREHGRGRYRPAHESFDPEAFEVRTISERDAKDFVVTHHYSHSFPSTRLSTGMFKLGRRGRKDRLVGVLTFGTPTSNAAPMKWAQVEDYLEAAELNRLVMLDEVKGEGESWFLRRVVPMAQDYYAGCGSNLKLILSYSDPIMRTDAKGNVVMPGHIGNIYQARGGHFAGRARASRSLMPADGTLISELSLRKVRALDTPQATRTRTRVGQKRKDPATGHAYVLSRLEAAGAPARRRGQSWNDWVDTLFAHPAFRDFRHPGNLTYLWAVGDKRQRRAVEAGFGMSDLDAWLTELRVKNTDLYHKESLLSPKTGRAPDPGLLSGYAHDPERWLKLLMGRRLRRSVKLGDSLRGLTAWLRWVAKMKRKVSHDQIFDWLDANTYPKRPRQRYIAFQRKYERAWSRGNMDRATELAGLMGDLWPTLGMAEQFGLEPPPGLSAVCALPPRGSSNRSRQGSLTLPQLLSRTVCSAPAGSGNRRRQVFDAATKVPWAEEMIGAAEMLL
jgi:hypothetical protein